MTATPPGVPAISSPWPAADGAARASALFRSAFGCEPDGVWSAPGRVNLIGEHTDHNGGLCLPVAIGHRTYAAVRARGDAVVRLVSAQHPAEPAVTRSAPESGRPIPAAPGAAAPPAWAAYVTGVVNGLQAAARGSGTPALAGLGVPPGADIAVDSCVPEGAGLSSSAALECAVAAGLAESAGADLSAPQLRRALAAVTRSAENLAVGVPSGPMDQTASLLSSAGHALLLDCGDGSATAVPFDPAAMGATVFVIDTRTAHSLADGAYALRRRECDAAARMLGVRTLSDAAVTEGDLARLVDPALQARARHVRTENARVRAFIGELGAPAPSPGVLGGLLDASHESLRHDFAVSTRELDLAAAAARDGGAYGARMVGAGFGGSVLALSPSDGDGVVQAVAAAFLARDLSAPRFYAVHPSPPARRET